MSGEICGQWLQPADLAPFPSCIGLRSCKVFVNESYWQDSYIDQCYRSRDHHNANTYYKLRANYRQVTCWLAVSRCRAGVQSAV